jgi:hypothetical protein
LGRFRSNLLPSPPRASLPVRPTRPITRAPARAGAAPPPPLTGWPHPLAAHSLSLVALPLATQARPSDPLSPPVNSPAQSPSITPLAPSSRHNSCASEVRHRSAPQITVLAACPRGLVPGAVHPHRRCGIPRLRQLVFGRFLPRAPIKRTVRAPRFRTPASATPSPLLRARLS